MSPPEVHEDATRRVAAFFVDLMATLTTEEVGEEEVTALLRSVWQNRAPNESGSREVGEEDLTAGFVRVAVTMAHMVVQERRAGGQLDACMSDVWSDLREFMASIDG
jgi:hypothetical protein